MSVEGSNHSSQMKQGREKDLRDPSNREPMTTPKLHQLQEVHQTTIMEENETMRGSIDRYPGSKLSHLNNRSNSKKYKQVGLDQNRRTQNTATNRKTGGVNQSAGTKKSLRTKSSVGGNFTGQKEDNGIAQMSSTASSAQHPMNKAKSTVKQNLSYQNLDESIHGVVGSSINKMHSRQQNTRHQTGPQTKGQSKVVSPNVHRKQQHQNKNQLQLSNQKNNISNSGRRREFQGLQMKGQGAPSFIYNGSGYASNNLSAQNHGHTNVDSDCEQSDFKTTTLRFTNNNFVEDRRRERDSSYGQIKDNQHAQSSMLNTLNSNTASAPRDRNVPFNKFGTSDNFQTGHYNVNGSNGKSKGFDQRTDGFTAARQGGKNVS